MPQMPQMPQMPAMPPGNYQQAYPSGGQPYPGAYPTQGGI